MILLAVDPGLRYPAAAIFKDGLLIAASRVKIPGTCHKLERGQRCLEVARLIRNWVLSKTDHIDQFVTEWPKVYRTGKADPADLFPLAGVGMTIAGFFDVPTSAPTAAEWIGNLPKSSLKGEELTSVRGRRIWSRLSEAEKVTVVISNDSVDACGIGLWSLGRLDRKLGLIGAT